MIWRAAPLVSNFRLLWRYLLIWFRVDRIEGAIR
jgi:hypothetical protein